MSAAAEQELIPPANRPLRVAWLCGIPKEIQQEVFGHLNLGPTPDWSWIVGHLPTPANVELHVISPSRRVKRVEHAECRGAHFHVIPVTPGGTHTFYWNWVLKYRPVLRAIQPDCVHGWGTEAGYGNVALQSGYPAIVGIQGLLTAYWPFLSHSFTLGLARLNERRTLRAAPCVVAEGTYSQQAGAPYTDAAIRVVPHPLRPAFVAAQPGRRDSQTIVFLGSPERRKGFTDALQAFARLNHRDWRLVCIGNLAPEKRAETQVELERLGIADRVELAGACSTAEVVGWLQRSPVLLLPSYMDTGPTALKEALAMGVWPVCYDNTGPQELISRYQFGSRAATGNIAELAAALQRAIDEKPWHDTARVQQCIATIRHDLERERIWQQLVQLYEERLRHAKHPD